MPQMPPQQRQSGRVPGSPWAARMCNMPKEASVRDAQHPRRGALGVGRKGLELHVQWQDDRFRRGGVWRAA